MAQMYPSSDRPASTRLSCRSVQPARSEVARGVVRGVVRRVACVRGRGVGTRKRTGRRFARCGQPTRSACASSAATMSRGGRSRSATGASGTRRSSRSFSTRRGRGARTRRSRSTRPTSCATSGSRRLAGALLGSEVGLGGAAEPRADGTSGWADLLDRDGGPAVRRGAEPVGRCLSARAAVGGDRWRFNLFRIKRPGGAANPERDAVYSAWSVPDGPSFHATDRFRDVGVRVEEWDWTAGRLDPLEMGRRSLKPRPTFLCQNPPPIGGFEVVRGLQHARQERPPPDHPRHPLARQTSRGPRRSTARTPP